MASATRWCWLDKYGLQALRTHIVKKCHLTVRRLAPLPSLQHRRLQHTNRPWSGVPPFTCICAAWSPFQLSAVQLLSLSPTLSCFASFIALCIIQFQLSKKCRPAHPSHIILHVPSYTVFSSHSLLTVLLPGSRSLGSCHSLSLEHCNL